MLMSLSMDSDLLVWTWKTFPPWEMSGVTTWDTGPNIPLKFKPHTKNQPKTKQANKQK